MLGACEPKFRAPLRIRTSPRVGALIALSIQSAAGEEERQAGLHYFRSACEDAKAAPRIADLTPAIVYEDQQMCQVFYQRSGRACDRQYSYLLLVSKLDVESYCVC